MIIVSFQRLTHLALMYNPLIKKTNSNSQLQPIQTPSSQEINTSIEPTLLSSKSDSSKEANKLQLSRGEMTTQLQESNPLGLQKSTRLYND